MVTGGGAICSTAGAIAPPVNMLDEALPYGENLAQLLVKEN